MAFTVLFVIAAAIALLAILGYVSWLLALPAIGLVVAVLIGYASRGPGPKKLS